MSYRNTIFPETGALVDEQDETADADVQRMAAQAVIETADDLPDETPATKALAALDAIGDLLAAELESDATKVGRRNSANDQAKLDEIYAAASAICDLCVALGATVDDADEAEADGGEVVALKASDLPPAELPEDAGAVKALDGDRIGGYAVRFGSEDEPDLSAFRDFFTKSTDFWLEHWQTRPMLYHHAQDEATKDAPVVGRWTAARVDDVGVWLEGQLNMAHRYAGAVKELVARGALRLSSDSAPHLVVRERRPSGAHEVKRWPLLAASLTPSPAEPRLLPITHLKSLYAAAGLPVPLEIDDSPEASDPDAAKAAPASAVEAAADPERERLIELEHIAILEATWTL